MAVRRNEMYKVKVKVEVRNRKFPVKEFPYWCDAADWVYQLGNTYTDDLRRVEMEIVDD